MDIIQTRMSVGSQLRTSGRALLVQMADGRNFYSVDGGDAVSPGDALILLNLPGFGATPEDFKRWQS